MMYLISQILLYVIVAALLGLLVGWLLTRNLADRRELRMRADWEAHMQGVRSLQAELSNNLHESEERLTQQTAQIEAMRIRISDADSVSAKKSAEIDQLRDTLETAEEELTRFTKALAKAANINSRLESDLAELRESPPQQIDEERIQQLEMTEQLLQEKVTLLGETLESRESDLVQLGAFNEELELQLAECRRELQELADPDEARKLVSALRGTILERDSQIEELNQNMNGLELQIANAESKLEHFEALQAQLREAEQELSTLRHLAEGKTESEQEPQALVAVSARPELYTTAPERTDNLRAINGIGKKLERTLHQLGIYQFHQLAGLNEQGEQWLDDQLDSLKGRVKRDQWVKQAQDLLSPE